MRQALVLVGGKGTRLGAITAATPKPLLPLGNGVFLDYLLTLFAKQGVAEFILLSGHFADQVVARYDGAVIAGARVSVVCEPEPAGTGGALRYAADRLDPAFLMMNGDSLFEVDHRRLEAALGQNDVGALALRRVPDGARYGRVELENGRVSAFREKDPGFTGEALISAGVYALRRRVLGLIGEGPCSIETDVFPRLAVHGQLAGLESEGYFIDIGLPDTLDQARREIPARFGSL
ncbi:MAG: sugar phosphate nucleotidyltransferase [Hyphomonadaceae bacterium]|nr:sugar phosphate nucleotidyltransferase [Hyphomonadaceae bacterium]